MKLQVNPEFGIELTLVIPYAYWLHKRGELEEVITSKGMSPYYYFCNNVKELFNYRTIDNKAAMPNIPNQWIHHNSFVVAGKHYEDMTPEEQFEVNGVLDYSKWTPPPYKEYYKNNEFIFEKPTVFISNKYNMEHGHDPKGFFNIQCLYEMFDYLKNYTVIYKRATNKEKEFAIDQNEYNSLLTGFHDIKSNVEGVGIITDFQLTKYFKNVVLLDDIVKSSPYSYNETQLRIMANCDRFISVCGGNAILSSLFKGTLLNYVHTGKELRPNYFGKNSYFRKLSDANVIPIIDRSVMKTGIPDYSELITKMKECF